MGNREAPVANMRFLLAVAVLTVVGTHAASDIVVKVDEEELSPLLRTKLCESWVRLQLCRGVFGFFRNGLAWPRPSILLDSPAFWVLVLFFYKIFKKKKYEVSTSSGDDLETTPM